MNKRREREPCSSDSSQETSPNPKNVKMADEEDNVLVSQESSENLPTLAMIYKTLMDVKSNTNKILEDIVSLKKEQDDLKQAVEFQSKTIEDVIKEHSKFKSIVKEQESIIQQVRGKVLEFTSSVNQLEEARDDLNQYQRKHNLEIHGIPEKEEEDLEAIVEELGKVLDVEIEYSDIDIVHRLPSKLVPRPIIVKFKS